MYIHEEGTNTTPQDDGDNHMGCIYISLGTTRQRMHKERAQNLNQSSADMAEKPENKNFEGAGLWNF